MDVQVRDEIEGVEREVSEIDAKRREYYGMMGVKSGTETSSGNASSPARDPRLTAAANTSRRRRRHSNETQSVAFKRSRHA